MAITRQIAAALIEGALNNGGVTLNLSDNRDRYIVGGLVPSFEVPEATARGSHDNMARQLQLPPGVHADTLGSWLHDGYVYVDYGTRVGTLTNALGLAEERGELAIWDSQDGEEIRVK